MFKTGDGVWYIPDKVEDAQRARILSFSSAAEVKIRVTTGPQTGKN